MTSFYQLLEYYILYHFEYRAVSHKRHKSFPVADPHNLAPPPPSSPKATYRSTPALVLSSNPQPTTFPWQNIQTQSHLPVHAPAQKPQADTSKPQTSLRNLSLRLYALEDLIPAITHASHHATGSFPADAAQSSATLQPLIVPLHYPEQENSKRSPPCDGCQATPRHAGSAYPCAGSSSSGRRHLFSCRRQSSAIGSPSSGGGDRSTGGVSSSCDGGTCSSSRGGPSPCGGGSSSPSDRADGAPSGVHGASQHPRVSAALLLVTAAHPLPSAVYLSCVGGFSSRGGTSSALGGRSPTGGGASSGGGGRPFTPGGPSSCGGGSSSVDGGPSSAGGGPRGYTYLGAWV
ncbi:hypothetical protein DFP73DRAFT_532341 [Morchella snyderi]|nr:hypothetical protein DFP73DRAFT_532341 [Morchella snyderi]